MAYFDGIKAGDRVYDMLYGWGTVGYVYEDTYSIVVEFDDRCVESFTAEGAYIDGHGQTLFWDKPEFVPPPRPRRNVKKTIERWVNVYLDGVEGGYTYKTLDEAIAGADDNEPVFYSVRLTGEYEVEE